jgi:hypothetical protein
VAITPSQRPATISAASSRGRPGRALTGIAASRSRSAAGTGAARRAASTEVFSTHSQWQAAFSLPALVLTSPYPLEARQSSEIGDACQPPHGGRPWLDKRTAVAALCCCTHLDIWASTVQPGNERGLALTSLSVGRHVCGLTVSARQFLCPPDLSEYEAGTLKE